MGFFDKFKKKEEPPKQVQVPEFKAPEPKPAAAPAPAKTAVPFNQAPRFVEVKFGTPNPVPFNDPKYGNIYLKATGSALIKTKAGVMDDDQIKRARSMLELKLLEAVGEFSNISYTELRVHGREIGKKISDAISDHFDVETIQIFTVVPDEASGKRIELMDKREQMSDPAVMAQKMAEAQAAAQARLDAMSPEEKEKIMQQSEAMMKAMEGKGPSGAPMTPEEISKMMSGMKAAATGGAVVCKNCGVVINGTKFCPECGAPV